MKKVFKFSLLSQVVIGVFITAFLTTAVVSAATTIGTNMTTAGTLEVTGNTITLGGTTPTMTVGDAGAEDAAIVYNGNAQDFYVGLDDTADDLVFGLGSALGTTQALGIDENLLVTMSADALLNGTTPTLTMGDAGAEDTQINFDGNAVDFSFGLDDTADKLVLGLGSTLGTTQRLTFNSADLNILVGDATAADVAFIYDGNAQDFYAGLDDSADDLVFGLGSALGTTQAIGIDENVDVTLGTNVMDVVIHKGRITTGSTAGAALALDSTYTYGEGAELRYTVSDWTGIGSQFQGIYLRPQSDIDAATATLRGGEIFAVANASAVGNLEGLNTYAYVKGDTAETINYIYGGHSEFTMDAGRANSLTTTEVGAHLAKVLSGKMADYTKIHGYVGMFGDMDGGSRTYGSGILLEDGVEAGTSILTSGLNINMAATNDIVLQNDDTITNGAAGVITFSTDIASTDGRLILGTETGGTCSTGLVIDLSAVAKGVITTIGETNTACAISFTNGTAGEVVFLSHDYTGTGVVTFADVTGFDATWTPVGATCSGIDAGVTAANDDHFYLVGVMTSATEIMITGCQYFNAA